MSPTHVVTMRREASRELLGEALEFVQLANDPAALDAFRMDYASYRLGASHGAKGSRPQRADEAPLGERETKLAAQLKKTTEELVKARRRVDELTKSMRGGPRGFLFSRGRDASERARPAERALADKAHIVTRRGTAAGVARRVHEL